MSPSADELFGLLSDAFSEALPDMNRELQQQAISAGWDRKVARTTELVIDQTNVSVVNHTYPTEAWDFEYGTQNKRLTAVARQYPQNSPKGSSSLMAKLGDKI